MPRPKKDSVPISLLMDRQIAKLLDDYCKENYLTKTAAIEKAVTLMLQKNPQERK